MCVSVWLGGEGRPKPNASLDIINSSAQNKNKNTVHTHTHKHTPRRTHYYIYLDYIVVYIESVEQRKPFRYAFPEMKIIYIWSASPMVGHIFSYASGCHCLLSFTPKYGSRSGWCVCVWPGHAGLGLINFLAVGLPYEHSSEQTKNHATHTHTHTPTSSLIPIHLIKPHESCTILLVGECTHTRAHTRTQTHKFLSIENYKSQSKIPNDT